MLKQKSVLEVVVNGKAYQLECYADSSLGQVYDVICQMKAYIVQRMLDEQKASEQNKEQVPDGSECKTEGEVCSPPAS